MLRKILIVILTFVFIISYYLLSAYNLKLAESYFASIVQSLLLYLIIVVLVRKGVIRKSDILLISITLGIISFVIGPLESYFTSHSDRRAERSIISYLIGPGTFTYIFVIIYSIFAYISVKSYKRIVTVLLMSLIYFSFLHIKVFRHWVYLLSFGRSGPTVDKDISHIPVMVNCNDLSDTIDLKSLPDKIVVIDVWSQFCGACFKQFPHFEDLKKSWSHDTNIVFYNVYVEFEPNNTFNPCDIIHEYDFNVVKTDEVFYDALEIKGLPIYYIFNEGRMVFEGHSEELNDKIIRLRKN